MKSSSFIKDRGMVYLSFMAAWLLSILFLMAYKVKTEVWIVLSVIWLFALFLVEIWEFVRKKRFYQKACEALETLDRAYLLCELLEEPEFYEGKIMYQALLRAGKSMCDEVALQKRRRQDFEEYIELWVHEANIPLSALFLICRNQAEEDPAISRQLHRLEEAIDNVLYYARSENAEKDYVFQPVDLRKLIVSVLLKQREALQAVEAGLSISGVRGSVMSDRKWLAYIVGQLLSNSIKYRSPERPLKITFGSEEEDDAYILRIEDNGIGISEEDLPHIIDKTFTGQNGRLRGQSTGMGLYIVDQLCHRLGHRIEIQSIPGCGSTFSLHFGKDSFSHLD